MAKRDRPESDKKSKKRSKKAKTKKDTTSSDVNEKEQEHRERATGNASTPASASIQRKARRAIFLKKKIDVELSLLPSSLHNTDDAVQSSLNQMLMKYSTGLGGIMLACENVRIKDNGNGWILNEHPWIHYTVSCDALVFRPYLGCEVSRS